MGGLSLRDTPLIGLTVYGTKWDPRLLFFFFCPVNHHGLTIAISALLLKVFSSLPVSTTEGLTSWGRTEGLLPHDSPLIQLPLWPYLTSPSLFSISLLSPSQALRQSLAPTVGLKRPLTMQPRLV